jgi:hypothetical protein
MFLYFLTLRQRTSALSFISSLFKLHFFLHKSAFGRQHGFLKDLVFSFFLVSNPGQFFDSSVLPLLPFCKMCTEDRALVYAPGSHLVRLDYWKQIALFVERLIPRMRTSIALLPGAARDLAGLILDIGRDDFKYVMLIEVCICRYLSHYVNTPDRELLQDTARVILCGCPMETRLAKEIAQVLRVIHIEVDSLMEAMRPGGLVTDDLAKGMDAYGHYTLVTTRDLALILRATATFQRFVPEESRGVLGSTLGGIMEPKSIDDVGFLNLRTWVSDSGTAEIALKSTQPYDELVDILNSIDVDVLDFQSPEELRENILVMCRSFVSNVLELQLTVDLLSDTETVEQKVTENRKTLQKFSDDLCTALFAARNEIKRCQKQCASLFSIHARISLVPALVEQFPYDFQFHHADVFTPEEAYDRLIQKVARRTGDLQLPPANEHIVTRTFFLDFVDQIDIAVEFQKKVKTAQVQQKLSGFLQLNSESMLEVSPQKRKLISRAATHFQKVQSRHTISYNLSMAIGALNLLTIFPDTAIMMAVALSGNAEVPSFTYFATRYFRDEKVAGVLMTPEERAHIERLRRAIEEVTHLAHRRVSLM